MTEPTLHKYLLHLNDEALQEFTQWCILEQAIAAGYEFTPDLQKLENLSPQDFIQELISQFLEVTRNSIEGGLAILLAGKQADQHALPGVGTLVEFISLYVLYLVPKGKNNTLPPDEKLAEALKEQLAKLYEIGHKNGVDIKALPQI
ncbi:MULTISPECIES: hypothetical protein [Nostocales]|uniref:Uncharacterized protein n=3 Tax=Nostocales TaxID=1161 RepID=A0A0C1RB72_9CYAN|nr:hypothetical protein [Tolypothrix bouteillei]KAF3888184.1 hypothetical protein DA73_0400023840 [Tolypothrix bouteillei VB521301]